MGKVSIVYWSGTGNTETMAAAMAEGAKDAGAEVELLTVDKAEAAALSEAKAFALGCPAMGAEELEEGEMEPFMAELDSRIAGKTIALFGSYGWGGQSVAQVEEELVKCGFNICMDKIRIQYVPTKEQLLEIESKVEALVS